MTGTAANTCTYYDFTLQIIDESDTGFVLSNCGESVGESNSINTQFMLMKEVLGFVQTDIGTFTTQISKFDDNIRVGAVKLVFYEGWLLRVIQVRDDTYQLIVAGDNLHTASWLRTNEAVTKWVKVADTKEVGACSSYWNDRR